MFFVSLDGGEQCLRRMTDKIVTAGQEKEPNPLLEANY